MSEWREAVYCASRFPKDSREYWDRIKEYIIDRDGYRCQACRKPGRAKRFTVHHIIPRSVGGADEPDNLITLHGKCHDYVEAMGLITRSEIINCTKGMSKSEIESSVFQDNADIPAIEIPPTETDEPTETDKVKILCPCGIYYLREQSLIGVSIKEMNCSICGRKGTYQDGKWAWALPRKTQPKPNVEIRPVVQPDPPKQKREPVVKVYLHSTVKCPVCNTTIQYLKTNFKFGGIKCTCGCEAELRDGSFWWRVLMKSEQNDLYR